MTRVVVTGAAGFIGRNLLAGLREREADGEGVELRTVTRESDAEEAAAALRAADVVFHLAGANRPDDPDDFHRVNRDFTREVADRLREGGRGATVVFASSVQVERDNAYGRSKRAAEQVLEDYADETEARVVLHRLPNVFGKWSRPHYNSVVATFCHEITRGNPVDVHDPDTALRLVHVDDVVRAFLCHLSDRGAGVERPRVAPVYTVRLGDLADRLRGFARMRGTLELPDLSDRFVRLLHGTFLSYLPDDGFGHALVERHDERGKLAEILKSGSGGQVFVSTTRPGVVRGGHYHHAKVEKFLVLRGQAVIRFREVGGDRVLRYPVSGDAWELVDIPPGYTHDIENVGEGEMVTLFWANEIFDPEDPDTHRLEVSP